MSKENFLTSEKGKRITGMAYGLGASVVIIGALFKIMHFPGAGPMLMAGMGCEAVLFALSAGSGILAYIIAAIVIPDEP